jgi:hypothetical protein
VGRQVKCKRARKHRSSKPGQLSLAHDWRAQLPKRARIRVERATAGEGQQISGHVHDNEAEHDESRHRQNRSTVRGQDWTRLRLW